MIAPVQDAQKLAPSRALDGHESVVAPLGVSLPRRHGGAVGGIPCGGFQSVPRFPLGVVEDHFGEPERMPDVHVVDAGCDAKVFDARIIRRRWVEHVVEVGRRQVGVCGRVDEREEKGRERGRKCGER